MITDTIINLFASILGKIVDLLPDAPIVAIGNGAASGTACCAAFLIGAISYLLGGVPGGGFSPGVTGSLANASPLPLVIDFYWLGFVAGCIMAIAVAFFIIKILLLIWQQVKW